MRLSLWLSFLVTVGGNPLPKPMWPGSGWGESAQTLEDVVRQATSQHRSQTELTPLPESLPWPANQPHPHWGYDPTEGSAHYQFPQALPQPYSPVQPQYLHDSLNRDVWTGHQIAPGQYEAWGDTGLHPTTHHDGAGFNLQTDYVRTHAAALQGSQHVSLPQPLSSSFNHHVDPGSWFGNQPQPPNVQAQSVLQGSMLMPHQASTAPALARGGFDQSFRGVVDSRQAAQNDAATTSNAVNRHVSEQAQILGPSLPPGKLLLPTDYKILPTPKLVEDVLEFIEREYGLRAGPFDDFTERFKSSYDSIPLRVTEMFRTSNPVFGARLPSGDVLFKFHSRTHAILKEISPQNRYMTLWTVEVDGNRATTLVLRAIIGVRTTFFAKGIRGKKVLTFDVVNPGGFRMERMLIPAKS